VPSHVVVAIALELEAQGLFANLGADVIFTGLGKVNAAYRLTRRLAELRAQGIAKPLVLNLGTAGSRRFATGSVVGCRRFVQRDMDVSGLGFAIGQTPFDGDVPAELEFPEVFSGLPHGTCATGDRFEAHAEHLPWDIIDMEAYAFAKVCFLEGLPFACAKFVSDGADGSAAGDWEASLPRAAREFVKLYEVLVKTAG
jgi:adenosylhomocysteine nucleosidase